MLSKPVLSPPRFTSYFGTFWPRYFHLYINPETEHHKEKQKSHITSGVDRRQEGREEGVSKAKVNG